MISTLMTLAFAVGAIVGLVKVKQGLKWGKGLLIACGTLAILFAGYKIMYPRGRGVSNREVERIRENAARYEKSAGEKLGLELAKKFPGAKAVVIRRVFFNDADPDAPPEVVPMMFTQRLAGLKEGLADAIEILDVIHPDSSPSLLVYIRDMKKKYAERTGKDEIPWPDYEREVCLDPDMQSPKIYDPTMGLPMKLASFNAVVKKIPPEATMVIVLGNFPNQLDRSDLWGKKLTVAGITNTSNAKLESAIQQGYISDIVISKPRESTTYKLHLPKGLEERFNKLFVYVTPDTVKAIAEANKVLFL